MPNRVNKFNDYYATKPGIPIDEPFQRCVEACASYAHNKVPPNLAVLETLSELHRESLKKSEAWHAKYITCDEFFRDVSPLRGSFVVFNYFLTYYPSIDYRHNFFVNGSPTYMHVFWTEKNISVLQAALDEEKPLRWGDGLYLFGKQLWELTKSDKVLSEDELRLVFLDAIDKDRQKFERLRRKFAGGVGTKLTPKRETIPEEVRIFVWRRDGGRCVLCSSQERLEFDHIVPVSKGGSNTERNVQLLCEPCNRKKSNNI